MPRTLELLAPWLLLCAGVDLPAQGGQFRGPGDLAPPIAARGPGPAPPGPLATPGPPGPPGPAPRVFFSGDLTRWEYWWAFNKDRYLDTGTAHRPALPAETRAEVFAVLQRAERSTDQPHIVSACLIAMARNDRTADPVLHEILRHRLRGPSQQIRETAALALGLWRNPEAVAELAALALGSRRAHAMTGRGYIDERTRVFAAYGLAHLGATTPDPMARARITAVFADLLLNTPAQGRDLRIAAVLGLGLLGPAMSPETRLERELLQTRLRILEELFARPVGIGEQIVLAFVPTAIARILGQHRAREVTRRWRVRLLAELTHDPLQPRNRLIRQSAVLALGQLCGPNEDEDSEDARYSEALRTYYQRGVDHQTRFFCLIALGQIGGRANRDALVDVLARGKKATERPWAALALGIYADEQYRAAEREGSEPEIESEIGGALQHQLDAIKNPATRSAMAIGLGLCRYRPAAGDLRMLLNRYRNMDDFAGYLAVSLALMRDEGAPPDLRSVFDRSTRRPDLQRNLARAIAVLGDRTDLPRLHRQLVTEDRHLSRLGAVAIALGTLADPASIPALRDALLDEETPPLTRAFVAVALGALGRDDAAPWNAALAEGINFRAATILLTNGASGVLDSL